MRDSFRSLLIGLLKGAILTACGLSFWPYLAAAGIKGQTGDYSHVFVIPLIAAVVYLRSERAADTAVRPGVAGALLACGLLLRGLGEWQGWLLVAEAAFPLLFIGFTELLFGHGQARRVTFPALFMLFGFGFVTDVLRKLFVNYLMLVSAGAAYDAATTFLPGHGPYIVAQNMIIVPPDLRFDVIEACAGIRGMLALFVIGSVLGYARKLNGRQAVRFLFLLTVAGLTINLVRIAATIVFSLLLREHFSHQAVHDTMNWVVFGPLILLIPVMVRRAQTGRFRIGLIGGLAMVMILAHAGQWHMRAAQGNARLLVRQTQGAEPQVTLEVDQQGLPRALLPYTSPEVNGKRHWRWVLTSAMVHGNILHLVVNVSLLLLLGHAIKRDLGPLWVTGVLLAGQIVGTLVGGWTLAPPPGMTSIVFTGASCAISGLFGAYLVAHLLAKQKWLQAPVFLALYVAGLWLSAGRLAGMHQLSFSSHLSGLLAGGLLGIVHTLRARQLGKIAATQP